MARSLQAFRTFQFQAIGGKVDVKYKTWGLAAKLDSRCPYAIVAIVLHKYIDECPAFGAGQVEMVIAKEVNHKHIDALLQDNVPVAKVNDGIRRIMNVYNPSPDSSMYRQKVSEVFTLKANVFGDFGRLLLKIGNALSDETMRKKTSVKSYGGDGAIVVLTPEERTHALLAAGIDVDHHFYKIEKRFREGMQKTGIYDLQNPMQATFLFPPTEKDKEQENKGKKNKEKKEEQGNESQALPSSAFAAEEKEARSAEVKDEDEKDLFNRLKIQGLLSHVLLRPDAPIKEVHLLSVEDNTPPRKRLRGAPTVEVKKEKAMQDSLMAAAKQALSQCSRKVMLQELEVPLAVVAIIGGAPVPSEAGGSGELAKQKIDITVSSDDLLPLPEDGHACKETDPTRMTEDQAHEVITTYPLHTHEAALLEATVTYALRATFMLSSLVLDEVKVLRMSDKKPWVYQVRSQETFHKGELVFMPFGNLFRRTARDCALEKPLPYVESVPFILTAPPLKTAAKAKGKAKAKAKAKRKAPGAEPESGPEPQSADVDKEQEIPHAEMMLKSPLLAAFDHETTTIQPFWAVPRLKRASTEQHNMELVKIVFEIPYPTFSDSSVRLSKAGLPKLFVTTAVMRNTKKVGVDDVLCLPYDADCGKVVQWHI